MIEIGQTLRRIREDCSYSLKQICDELKPHISVSIDFLSKVENGYRNPTLQLIEGLSKVYELPSLIDFYYTVELHNQLSEHPNPKKLIRKVLKEWDTKPTFTDTSPKSKWGLNGLGHTSKYLKGGRNGKVKGFDFYLTKNGTLQPKHRRILLEESRGWMMNTPTDRYNKSSLENGELDSSYSDLELVEMWNEFYDRRGYLIPEFREKWEREFLPSVEEQKKGLRKSQKNTVGNEPSEKSEITNLKWFQKPTVKLIDWE
jgi:transcriptional regulator with XRE-family HTH domain